MNQTNIKHLDAATWPTSVAILIRDAIQKTLLERGSCNVMLTGGRSAEKLYLAWAALPDFQNLRDVRFYVGDERCVPTEHPDRNYGLVMRTLFSRGLPKGCAIVRMEADHADRDAAAVDYEQQLPEKLDVLLLSMGEDGHIASLFPHSAALHETRRRVVSVTGPKSPFQRLTITPTVIQNAREVFVLALGEQKRAVYEEALRNSADIDAIPARLVLSRTWIFGD